MSNLAIASLLFFVGSVSASAQHQRVYLYTLHTDPEFQVDDFSTPQERSRWCWAACIQMVYAHAGVHLEQEDIVNVTSGMISNTGADGDQIAAFFERKFFDKPGHLVGGGARVRKFHRAIEFNIATELSRGRPIIALYREHGFGHAVVIVGVAIESHVPQALGYFVRDPWPDQWHSDRPKGRQAVFKSWLAPAFEAKVEWLVFPIIFTPESAQQFPRENAENIAISRARTAIGSNDAAGLEFLEIVGLRRNTVEKFDNVDRFTDYLKLLQKKHDMRAVLPW